MLCRVEHPIHIQILSWVLCLVEHPFHMQGKCHLMSLSLPIVWKQQILYSMKPHYVIQAMTKLACIQNGLTKYEKEIKGLEDYGWKLKKINCLFPLAFRLLTFPLASLYSSSNLLSDIFTYSFGSHRSAYCAKKALYPPSNTKRWG